MKFNFKKISAIATSVLMVGMTMGVAAAANYPDPFVVGGTANAAIIYGTGTGRDVLDVLEAGNIQSNLQSYMTGTSTSSTASVSGEAAELFTGGSKVYINNTLNSVISVLTSNKLPTVLADQTFSGNVDATTTQTITLGSDPIIKYDKQPTSSDDPSLALAFSTSSGKFLYNASATFNKAVNFTHSDSEGEDIKLFGTTWTISSATDATDLVLLKSAEKASLSTDSPTAEVTVAGKKYTVEMISASDTAATIQITNEDGKSENKEIKEAQSKTVNGVTVAVITADETNLKLSASVVVGSDKITLTDGSSITHGEDASVIDGTKATLTGGTTATTKITVSVYAPESDKDAILAGGSFIDPVFGTFKVDFPGFNIAEDSTSREEIKIANSGDDKMEITMTDHRGNAKTVQYVYNASKMALQWNTNGNDIIISERTPVNYSDYVILGNEDEGRLVKLTTLTNQSSGYSSDKVVFTDVFSGETYTASLTSDGGGTVVVGGKEYTVAYNFSSDIASEAKTVSIQYPDSSATGDMIIYPTIQTSKGAKIMFYKPLTLNITSWDTGAGGDLKVATGKSSVGVALGNIKIPNGADTYQSIAVVPVAQLGNVNLSIGGTIIAANAADGGNQSFTVINITNTGLSFNFTWDASNSTKVYLTEPDGSGNIVDPAIVVLEEKDDGNKYEAFIITTEPGNTADDGIGVDSILRTWSDDVTWNAVSLYSDSKKTKEADRWGTLGLVDSGDSDQKTATISYPDEQVYANFYVAANEAEISMGGGTTAGTQLGNVVFKDTETSSYNTKNVIVVGGSCINSAAAALVGGAYCVAEWTEKTGIGSGQFLIKGYATSSITSKLALLVAGYDAADTVNAATYLRTKTVDTSKEYKGTSATTAELVTTETA